MLGKIIKLSNQKSATLLGVTTGLCFAINVLNDVRIKPNSSFWGESLGIALLSLALLLFFLCNPLKKIGLSVLTWLMLLVIILLQSVISEIAYPDELLFPAVTLVIATFVAVAVQQIEDREKLIKNLAIGIVFTALLTVVIQLAQLLWVPEGIPHLIFPLFEGHTPYGNITQRNQLAFILTMAIAILLHFSKGLSYIRLFIICVLIVFLSIGMGMTPSRGGLILLVFAVLFWVVFDILLGKKSNYRLMVFCPFIIAVGYFIGAWLLAKFAVTDTNIVGRFSESSLYLRLSLLNQAWLIFQDNIWLGLGWNNYNFGAFAYTEQLRWFYFSNHAHSVIPQIAAELGIVGILAVIPVVLAIFKNIRIKYEGVASLIMSLIAINVLYSFSEFPLWYSFYLFIFVILVASLESKRQLRKAYNILRPLMLVILVCLFFGAIYYHNVFKGYARTTSVIASDTDIKDKVSAYQEQSNIFGFSVLNELLLFSMVDVSSENIDNKLALGYRVIGRYTSVPKINKLAVLEGIKGNDKKSLKLFQSACLFNERRSCDQVTELIDNLAKDYPDIFAQIATDYGVWLKSLP